MDERTMIDVSTLPLSVTLAACFLGGLALGFAYFLALRQTANLIVAGGQPLLGLALTLGRLAFLAAGFYLAVLAGGLALITALAGVLVAKALLLAQMRRAG